MQNFMVIFLIQLFKENKIKLCVTQTTYIGIMLSKVKSQCISSQLPELKSTIQNPVCDF